MINKFPERLEENTWNDMEASLSKKIGDGFSPLREKSIVVAFSGDINSTLVAQITQERFTNVCLVTLISTWLDESEINEIRATAGQFHFPHVFEKIPADVLNHTLWGAPERCFYCKILTSSHLLDYAKRMGYDVVIDGSDASDRDNLPYYFSVSKLGVYSPLAAGEMTHEEVERLASHYGLKPRIGSLQICPSERFPDGGPIKPDKIERVLQAESFLKDFNISAHLKLSDHEDLCRILIDRKSFESATHNINQNREEIISFLKSLGYIYITLDLEGR